jgi:SAM-dependent methyltransferase
VSVTELAEPAEPYPKFREWTSDRKLTPLRASDLAADPSPESIDVLREYAAARGKPPTEITVLDFGCGRGADVGRLRRQGWRAFGIEVDPRFVEAGAIVNSAGAEEYPILTTVRPDGRTCFPDGYFDVVISDQVLEHVSNLDAVAAEMARLLKVSGLAVNVHPPRFSVIEPHYKLPFAHWLPKNRLRRAWIHAMLALGLGVEGREPLSTAARTEVIYRYSVEETFYGRLRQPKGRFAHRASCSTSTSSQVGSCAGRPRNLPALGALPCAS